jgi:hypothetical protein
MVAACRAVVKPSSFCICSVRHEKRTYLLNKFRKSVSENKWLQGDPCWGLVRGKASARVKVRVGWR